MKFYTYIGEGEFTFEDGSPVIILPDESNGASLVVENVITGERWPTQKENLVPVLRGMKDSLRAIVRAKKQFDKLKKEVIKIEHQLTAGY